MISIDASAGLAAEAKRLRAVDVRVLNFVTLDYDSCFEGIWAWASLHHAQGDELPVIFARLRRALKPNGVLHASLKAGAKDRRDKFERFFCAMDEARLRTLAAGWSDVRIDRNQRAGYDDEPTPWLRLRARA